MEPSEIKQHWQNWAEAYGTNVRATTMSQSAKTLEIDALCRHLIMFLKLARDVHVLEVGCGNGINCIEIAKRFPNFRIDGIDYVHDMVMAAKENAEARGVRDQTRFSVCNIFDMENHPGLRPLYDVVITDRCIINLNTWELQKRAIKVLADKVRAGGYLLMIENSITRRDEQNRLRSLLGMSTRPPAPFNLFLNEDNLLPYLPTVDLKLSEIEDFSSLHDLILYVLVPAINGGKVDYEHPMVKAATDLSIAASVWTPNIFGSFGQNRLFVCRKV